jgi:hypothetical protein
MHTLCSYHDTHLELRQMIDDLRAVLTVEQLHIRANAKSAYELLCDLGERVHRHLDEEDRGLYPSLLIHDDPKVKSIAWGFISGEKPLRQTFDDYNTHWLKNCDYNFTNAFLVESEAVFDLVGQRVDREEQVLLPKLIEIGMLHEPRK